MKVLHSCLSKSWGGMEMYSLNTARTLIDAGIDVELLCSPNSRLHIEAVKHRIKVHAFSFGRYFTPASLYRLNKLIRKNKFDLIHAESSKDLWLIVPALRLTSCKTPLVMTKHVGSFINKKDFFHRWIYKRVNVALAISRVIKSNLLQTTPLDEAHVLLLYDSIDTEKFNPAKVKGKKIRKEFGIRDDELLIGMSGRFSPGKGHEEFLSAVKHLSRKFSNLRFMIVGEPSMGEDSYAADIKILASEQGLIDKIIFTGYRADVPQVLAAMDIFVFPSHAEAFGMALAEAMSMEKPSVCSNSDGVLEIAVDGVTSYLFESKNAKDLANKIEVLINSPAKRKEFGEAARKRVIDLFNINKFTKELLSIYDSLVKEKHSKQEPASNLHLKAEQI
ncbi:MAG: glycosyltransferase family 4 protein [Bacteroidetes bacterium]|nr:glycosyltransferase family 4 protein [Bacteroidota bacterium]